MDIRNNILTYENQIIHDRCTIFICTNWKKPNAHPIHGYVLVLGCKQDKVINLITLSKLEQLDLKQQQKPL
jgi:hypothetical protein